MTHTHTHTPVASTRVEGCGDEPCEPTVRLPDWSELVASYSRMKSAWGWANGGKPILVCYRPIRKYVIILGGYSRWRPHQPKYWGDVSPASPAGLTPVGRCLCTAHELNRTAVRKLEFVQSELFHWNACVQNSSSTTSPSFSHPVKWWRWLAWPMNASWRSCN